MGQYSISGIMQTVELGSISAVYRETEHPADRVLRLLALHNINIAFICTLTRTDGCRSCTLCVHARDLSEAVTLLEQECAAPCLHTVSPTGVLSLFPHREHAGVFGRTIRALSVSGIPLLASASSLSAVSCVLNEPDLPAAVRVLSREFSLQ